MKSTTSKMKYLFIAMFTLVALSGCSPYAKDGGAPRAIKNSDHIWDQFFVTPVAWLMDIVTNYTGYFAIGVILVTIIVRTIAFPIYTKTNDNSAKMQAIQPDIKKVQNKYAGKTDPESRQRMQAEVMKVYKDNNVNMLAGCLMPFLQMPIFLAMYHAVVRAPVTYEMDPGTMSFFFTSLSSKGLTGADGSYLNIILPIIVVITSVLQQKVSMLGMSEEAKNNPTMKMMMYVMPIMMFVFSIMQVQALSLYWIAGNIYSTLQVLYVKRPFAKHNQDNQTTKKLTSK